MSVRKRGGSWTAIIKQNGAYCTSSTFATRALATAWEQSVLADLSRGYDPRAGKIPLGDLIPGYLDARRTLVAETTWKTDKFMLAWVPLRVRRLSAAKIGSGIIEDLLGEEARAGRSLNSLRRYKVSLSALFEYLMRRKVVASNPVRGVRVPAARPPEPIRPFTWTEVEHRLARFREHSPELAEVILLLSRTGLRWSEARELRVKDVQLVPVPAVLVSRARPEGTAAKSTKSGKSRLVPLESDFVLPYVRARMEGLSAEDLLLPPLNKSRFLQRLDWASNASGFTVHGLRHGFATELLSRGLGLDEVSALLGHADVSTTARVYVHWIGAERNAGTLARMNRAITAGQHPSNAERGEVG